MNTSDIIIVMLLLAVVAAGIYSAATSPGFFVGVVETLGKQYLPKLIAFALSRMPPEEEARWRENQRMGGSDWKRDHKDGTPWNHSGESH